MLGAVVAFRRAEHMRMTAFISNAAPKARRYFEALAVAVGAGFLGFLLQPALKFAIEELPITTPALEISNAWRAGALPWEIGMMLA